MYSRVSIKQVAGRELAGLSPRRFKSRPPLAVGILAMLDTADVLLEGRRSLQAQRGDRAWWQALSTDFVREAGKPGKQREGTRAAQSQGSPSDLHIAPRPSWYGSETSPSASKAYPHSPRQLLTPLFLSSIIPCFIAVSSQGQSSSTLMLSKPQPFAPTCHVVTSPQGNGTFAALPFLHSGLFDG